MEFLNNLFVGGKLGAENVLLICTGILYLILWFLKRQERYRRLRSNLYAGIFFVSYGFLFDLFRYRWFRFHYFRHFRNVMAWRIFILAVLLLPLYFTLIRDIRDLLTQYKSEVISHDGDPE